MSRERIYYTKPSITEKEVAYATDAARNGWGDHCYEYITRFEEIFKSHLGVEYAIATSSCTGALHMGLAALGVGVGDEVVLADINWIASAAPIVHLGAKPVFVDVLPDSWCLDPDLAEAAITPLSPYTCTVTCATWIGFWLSARSTVFRSLRMPQKP
jgi:perosamine synthetase